MSVPGTELEENREEGGWVFTVPYSQRFLKNHGQCRGYVGPSEDPQLSSPPSFSRSAGPPPLLTVVREGTRRGFFSSSLSSLLSSGNGQ